MKKKLSKSQFLLDVSSEKAFWCNDGKIFLNLQDLEKGMKKMSSKIYRYHANPEKNDFAIWIEDSIGDKTLSSNIKKADTKEKALSILKKRIQTLLK